MLIYFDKYYLANIARGKAEFWSQSFCKIFLNTVNLTEYLPPGTSTLIVLDIRQTKKSRYKIVLRPNGNFDNSLPRDIILPVDINFNLRNCNKMITESATDVVVQDDGLSIHRIQLMLLEQNKIRGNLASISYEYQDKFWNRIFINILESELIKKLKLDLVNDILFSDFPIEANGIEIFNIKAHPKKNNRSVFFVLEIHPFQLEGIIPTFLGDPLNVIIQIPKINFDLFHTDPGILTSTDYINFVILPCIKLVSIYPSEFEYQYPKTKSRIFNGTNPSALQLWTSMKSFVQDGKTFENQGPENINNQAIATLTSPKIL